VTMLVVLGGSSMGILGENIVDTSREDTQAQHIGSLAVEGRSSTTPSGGLLSTSY
jgi:hypothetical protein